MTLSIRDVFLFFHKHSQVFIFCNSTKLAITVSIYKVEYSV